VTVGGSPGADAPLGRILLVGLLLTLATFGVGVAARTPCPRPCVSDLPILYQSRGIRPDAPPYLSRNLEYPVAIGGAFYAVTLVTKTSRSFFFATVALMGGLALGVTVLLVRRAGRHALLWALAPPLALYGALNWDLLAVAPAVAGLLAYESGGFALAGCLLAVGAAAKVYPGLYVVVLVIDRLAVGDHRGARRVAVAAGGTLLALNLPVLLAAPHGWAYPFRFQAARQPTQSSLWNYVWHFPSLPPWLHGTAVDVVPTVGSLLVVVVGLGIALRRVWSRTLEPMAAAAFVTGVFLLANKVYSPQYDLWLVPFLVILAVPWRNVVWFFSADAAIFVVTFSILNREIASTPAWAWLRFALVLWRAAAIVALLRQWLASTRRTEFRPEMGWARAGL
jgi:uncharacterized membrane protein